MQQICRYPAVILLQDATQTPSGIEEGIWLDEEVPQYTGACIPGLRAAVGFEVPTTSIETPLA